jgi:competence protein ComGC
MSRSFKSKRNSIIIFSLFVSIIIVAVVLVVLLPSFVKKHQTIVPKPVNVFGKSQAQKSENFPAKKPEFTAIIGSMKPLSVKQKTFSIYRLNDPKKTILFQRGFYADGFRGNELKYTVSSSAASFEQSGLIGSIGCSSQDCLLPWRNFYTWDAKQQIVTTQPSSKEA